MLIYMLIRTHVYSVYSSVLGPRIRIAAVDVGVKWATPQTVQNGFRPQTVQNAQSGRHLVTKGISGPVVDPTDALRMPQGFIQNVSKCFTPVQAECGRAGWSLSFRTDIATSVRNCVTSCHFFSPAFPVTLSLRWWIFAAMYSSHHQPLMLEAIASLNLMEAVHVPHWK